MRVRIRGIYATALSKLLLDHGFVITLPSETIAKRLNIPQLTDPPDVTIKSLEEDPETILVIGFKEPQERVVKILREHLSYSGFVNSLVGVHALVVGRVIEAKERNYVVDFGSFRGILRRRKDERLGIGEKRAFRIAIPPTTVNKEARVDTKPAIVGKYARVFLDDSFPSVSKHIKDESKRRRLLELARNLPRGFTVHRRSSAEYAPESALLEELRELPGELKRLLKLAEGADVGDVIYYGEALTAIHTSTSDRAYLDAIRDKVLPTIEGHHARKSAYSAINKDLSVAIDVLEKALELGSSRERLREAMISYSLEASAMKIIHKKPDGETLRLKEGKVVRFDGKELVLMREFSGHGIYDGLNIPIEPGDYDLMHVYLGERHIVHEYYSKEGRLKGIYGNVNTPPEILPGAIRYTDLYIDVVMRPGEEPRIIDEDELKEAFDLGIISRKLYEKAFEEAKKLIERLAPRTPRCFLPHKPRAPLSSCASRGTRAASYRPARPRP